MLGIAPDGKCRFPRTSPPLLICPTSEAAVRASESILIESSHECVSDPFLRVPPPSPHPSSPPNQSLPSSNPPFLSDSHKVCFTYRGLGGIGYHWLIACPIIMNRSKITALFCSQREMLCPSPRTPHLQTY